jgi:hypothetical protein
MGLLPKQEWSYTRAANSLFSGSPGEDAQSAQCCPDQYF